MRQINDKEKIVMIIKGLISEKYEITVRINDEKAEFASRVINISGDALSSSAGKGSGIVIERLTPDKGNTSIQSASKVSLEFLISGKDCRCSTDYLGISSTPPYFGFFLSIPETIEVKEKRYDERVSYELPDFVSAEFKLGKDPKGNKLYELAVMNCSSHGLGLAITKENFDLLDKLKVGDRIKDMAFFAEWSMVKVSGLVKHISKIQTGKYKGGYQLGIESQDIIDSCRPNKDS